MNYNPLLVVDLETGSKRAWRTQPTQICAVVVDGRKLKIVDGGVFQSYINVVTDETLLKDYGLDAIEEEALNITGITWDQIKSAPSVQVVWNSFVQFVKQFNPSGKKWDMPVLCGYNNNNFDDIILRRIAGGHAGHIGAVKEPYKFGPWDEEYQQCTIFHPIHNIDIMKLIFYWFESHQGMRSTSFDTMRDYMGIAKEGAHNAVVDTVQSAYLLIKLLKLQRYLNPSEQRETGAQRIKFENSFSKENDEISRIVERYTK